MCGGEIFMMLPPQSVACVSDMEIQPDAVRNKATPVL